MHATRGGELENVEEVTIPVLSLLDDKWADYSLDFVRRMAGEEQPWFLYHCTRGAHFDNYPHERFLGSSPAKHPYKDTIIELDDIVGRLVAELEATGQLEDTLVFVSSDNGPEMETWPDAAYSPFRSAKGSTWEGGQRVPGHRRVARDDRRRPRVRRPVLAHGPASRRCCASPAPRPTIPDDRFIDGVDQTSFLLARRRRLEPQVPLLLARAARSRRCGSASGSSCSRRPPTTTATCMNLGGFSGVTQKYTYGRLYNLYLDPKETRSYMIRKLAYLEAFQTRRSSTTSARSRSTRPSRSSAGWADSNRAR